MVLHKFKIFKNCIYLIKLLYLYKTFKIVIFVIYKNSVSQVQKLFKRVCFDAISINLCLPQESVFSA